jgi:hypothetical protein
MMKIRTPKPQIMTKKKMKKKQMIRSSLIYSESVDITSSLVSSKPSYISKSSKENSLLFSGVSLSIPKMLSLNSINSVMESILVIMESKETQW